MRTIAEMIEDTHEVLTGVDWILLPREKKREEEKQKREETKPNWQRDSERLWGSPAETERLRGKALREPGELRKLWELFQQLTFVPREDPISENPLPPKGEYLFRILSQGTVVVTFTLGRSREKQGYFACMEAFGYGTVVTQCSLKEFYESLPVPEEEYDLGTMIQGMDFLGEK